MNRYIILWLIGWMMSGWTVSAQQIAVSTIFLENPFAFNPAVAGADKAFKVRMDNRLQWLGFGDAPVTNMVSGFGPHKVRNIGYGANIVSDLTGPVSMLKLNGAFASNFAVTNDVRASFGLNLGFIQYRADGTILEYYDPDDPSVNSAVMSSFQPDAGFGVYVYHYDWYLGISAQQLFNNNLKFGSDGEDSKRNRLKTHFYGLAGYQFKDGVAAKWIIEPAVLLRKVAATPLQMDISGRVIYNRQFWGGLSARNTFASFNDLSLLLGYIHARKIHVSIAYDFTFAKVRQYTAGTIELVFGYNFDEIRKGR